MGFAEELEKFTLEEAEETDFSALEVEFQYAELTDLYNLN